jgi:hypothetical protein
LGSPMTPERLREIHERWADKETRNSHGCDGCGCPCCDAVPELLRALGMTIPLTPWEISKAKDLKKQQERG